jgi:hypothetical protein
MKAQVVSLALVTSTALVLGGCMRAVEDEAASETTTAALSTSQQAGLTQSALELDEADAKDPMKAAEAVATKPLTALQPAGCAERTRSGATVNVVFKDCTGPFGKMHLKGSLAITFSSPSPDEIAAALVGGRDLTINDRPLHYRANGSITFEGAKRKLLWHGESAGTTKRGVEFDRRNDLDLVFDVATRCVDASGSSRGKIGRYQLDLVVDGFSMCPSKCPTSGHVVATLDGPRKDRSLEVDFDGTDKAKVKGFEGRRSEIQMACDDGEAE